MLHPVYPSKYYFAIEIKNDVEYKFHYFKVYAAESTKKIGEQK